jgi:hypothetical protein
VPRRELDRRFAAVTPSDHDGRRGVERLEQGRRIIGVLDDARLVWIGSLAPRAAAPVIQDHPSKAR